MSEAERRMIDDLAAPQPQQVPYPPDYSVTSTPTNRSLFLYAALAILGIANVGGVTLIGMSAVENKLQVIGLVGAVNTVLISHLVMMAKNESETRKTRHDLKGDMNTVSLQTQLTQRLIAIHERQAEERQTKVKEVAEKLEITTRAELEKVIEGTVQKVIQEFGEEFCTKLHAKQPIQVELQLPPESQPQPR